MRIRHLKTIVAVGAGALAVTPPLGAASPAVAARKGACHWSMSMHAPNHQPRVNRNWIVTVRLHPGSLVGHPLYQFLFNGQKVSTQYVNGNRHFKFRGHYSDPFKWPKKSVGYPLTLRVVVRTSCGTKFKDWAVKVRK